MAIREKYFPGTGVSRYLAPGEHSWDEALYQSGRPILDSELNLSQEVNKVLRSLVQDREIPSGWLRGPTPMGYRSDTGLSTDFTTGTVSSDQFLMKKRFALVAGLPITVNFNNTATTGSNLIQLEAAPIFGGAPPDVKRTDFVFLEVWRAVVSASPRATAVTEVINNVNVVVGDVLTINGVPLAAVAGAPGVDQFQIGGSEAATASNISIAVNDGGNSFTGICTAAIDVSNAGQVNLRAADAFAGVAGNALTLSLTLTNAGAVTVNGGAGPTTFAGGADAPNKPSQATIYRNGNVDADPSVNLPDDIVDPLVNIETSKRVQIQYRIRVTGQAEAINFKTENGYSNANVLAQGAQALPVVGYPFVPADNATVNGSSNATAYQTVDPGLWISGDGSEAAATALGTVDGYVYSIPLCFVFRRNDAYNGGSGAGFDPLSNANGGLPSTHPGFVNPNIGVIPANTSDRPDGRFHDMIVDGDILDLRREVVPGGIDLKAEMERQMTALLDGNLGTWAIDSSDKNELGSGSGDVSTQFLVCNEIGRSGANGGVPPASGDTSRGDSIGDFDHIRRRFADWPVVERRIFPILPTADIGTEPGLYVTKTTPAFPTWEEGDVLNLDLNNLDATGLGDWLNAPSGAPFGGGSVANLWPPGTTVTDVLRVIHDDGNSASPIIKDVEIDQVNGIGTPQVQIRLAQNHRDANGGIQAIQATAVATVVAFPSTADLTIGGVVLTDAGGPRTPASNDYDGTLGSAALIAADMVAAINDGGNTFTTEATAVDSGGGVITLTAVPVGLAGNAVTLTTSDAGDVTVSGGLLAGGSGGTSYPLVGLAAVPASPRRIFVELEISYPIGNGTTDTPDLEVVPDATVYPNGPLIEDDTSQRPDDWEGVLPAAFREGQREVNIEYASNDGSGAGSGAPITDTIVSDTALSLTLPRRIYGSGTTVTSVTDISGVPAPVSVDTTATEYGSSSRLLTIQGGTPLGAAQALCNVEYFAQDPLPNWGAVGYQIATYYRSNAPQTVGVQAGAPATYPLPATLEVRPVVMSRDLWTGTVSAGSADLGFPYPNPLDQIAVNGDMVPAQFPAEWILQATAQISVGDFDAHTGLLNLHQMSPADGNQDFSFSDRDVDTEFRAHYKVADPSSYRPTAMAQPLSGVVTHKVFFPFLARASADNVLFRKNEILLIVVSRFAVLDGDNVVRFTDTNNESCAAVYRTRGLLLLASE